MKLVADEDVDRPIVERLRHDGHETVYVAEWSPSIKDDEVLKEANDRGTVAPRRPVAHVRQHGDSGRSKAERRRKWRASCWEIRKCHFFVM